MIICGIFVSDIQGFKDDICTLNVWGLALMHRFRPYFMSPTKCQLDFCPVIRLLTRLNQHMEC